MKPSGIITITTDFGAAGSYAGAMKGVILSINPSAAVVDVTHSVGPQQVEEGAFLLASVAPFFPDGTVHVAVIDPGVGTERRPLVLITPTAFLVGPDNGLLATALPDVYRRDYDQRVKLPPGFRAFRLTNNIYFRRPVSSTFHGRDIFSPVAAHLSRGIDPAHLGEEVFDITNIRSFRARLLPSGVLLGRVIHIDHFGNLITDVHSDQLPENVSIRVSEVDVTTLVDTYQRQEGLVGLIGSTGYLEIALRNGSAADALRGFIGMEVHVTGR